MRLRFLSLILFALLSWPLGWVSEARVHVQNLGGSIASVAQLPGARFVRWVEARGLSLGEQERVESYLSRRCELLGSPHPTGYGQVVEELTVSGGVTNLSKVYTVGMGLVSQRVISGSVVSFYGTDGHGSVRFLTRTNGLVTDTYTFDAFGTLIAGTITTSNNYLYCGEQWDADLGRYFLRARYYEPGLGRFTTMDTFEGNQNDPLSLHKYLYCQDNPVNMVDPSGRDGTGTAAGLGGTITIGGILEGLTLPAISGARLWAMTKIGVTAVAITATLSGDRSQAPNAMRLQLQEGHNFHYWSVPIVARANPGVTRKQAQLTLTAMFTAMDLKENLEEDWDSFPFSRWEPLLWSGIIRMSGRLNTFGPVSGAGTVLQEYLDPTNPRGPRIDLENLRGINLRQ